MDNIGTKDSRILKKEGKKKEEKQKRKEEKRNRGSRRSPKIRARVRDTGTQARRVCIPTDRPVCLRDRNLNSYISGERKAGPERSRSREKERERERERKKKDAWRGRKKTSSGKRRTTSRSRRRTRRGDGGRGEKLGRKEGAARAERGGAYGGYVGPSWGQWCYGNSGGGEEGRGWKT